LRVHEARDVQLLRGRRLLVAERFRVTERDSRGRVLCAKEFADPVAARRLPNGHAAIAGPVSSRSCRAAVR
jgi:hypothetical protein